MMLECTMIYFLLFGISLFKVFVSLFNRCEADPGALAKYVVALVKKDKPLPELKDSCVDQLDVFLQNSKFHFQYRTIYFFAQI